MAIPVLWAYVEYDKFQLGKGVLFFGLGIALLAQCCFFLVPEAFSKEHPLKQQHKEDS